MSGLKTLSQPLSDMAKFQSILQKASKILVLSGAGISAESGVPTFRGAGGLWRTYRSQDLATPQAFKKSPSLVWEFYHYRRELVLTKEPNKAHLAIAAAQKVLAEQGKCLTVVTQNVDGLHSRAGATNVIELHGNLYKTRCLKCGAIEDNTDSPIVPALKDRGTKKNIESYVKNHMDQLFLGRHIPAPLHSSSVRTYSTTPTSDAEKKDGSAEDTPKKLQLKEKLKIAMRDYGSTVIVFHITHSLALLGIIYIALSSGLDVKWMLESVGVNSSSIATGASTFVVAYAVNKILAPVRMSITLGATPFIVRYLRKIGFLKMPPPSPPAV